MSAGRIHKQIICDPATLTRLAWITTYAREVIGMAHADTRPTTILRRAVDLYVCHLERIHRLPEGHHDPTKDRDLANGLERMRLREMARDHDLGVPLEDACALPLRCLSDIVRAHAPPVLEPEKPIERIRRELAAGRTPEDGLCMKDDDDASTLYE